LAELSLSLSLILPFDAIVFDLFLFDPSISHKQIHGLQFLGSHSIAYCLTLGSNKAFIAKYKDVSEENIHPSTPNSERHIPLKARQVFTKPHSVRLQKTAIFESMLFHAFRNLLLFPFQQLLFLLLFVLLLLISTFLSFPTFHH
jgi:hypothetical protein